jgi:putative intracellular protease/amidase
VVIGQMTEKRGNHQEIARPFFAASKPVVSICHGTWLLASADLVRGRSLTSHWHDGVPEEIKAAGGNWVDEPVVVDGDLVTARWPADIPAFTPAPDRGGRLTHLRCSARTRRTTISLPGRVIPLRR